VANRKGGKINTVLHGRRKFWEKGRGRRGGRKGEGNNPAIKGWKSQSYSEKEKDGQRARRLPAKGSEGKAPKLGKTKRSGIAKLEETKTGHKKGRGSRKIPLDGIGQ